MKFADSVLVVFGCSALLISWPFLCNASVFDELEAEYVDDGAIEYADVFGDPDVWPPVGDSGFILKAATCTQCPRRLRPPKPSCTSCSSDDSCGKHKICCPFITLSTTARACSVEQRNNCRLTHEIQVDFLRTACSCVRQIKCCVSSVSVPATIAPASTTPNTTGHNDSAVVTTSQTKAPSTTTVTKPTTTRTVYRRIDE